MKDWEKLDFTLDIKSFAWNLHKMHQTIEYKYADLAALYAKFTVNDFHAIEKKWMK